MPAHCFRAQTAMPATTSRVHLLRPRGWVDRAGPAAQRQSCADTTAAPPNQSPAMVAPAVMLARHSSASQDGPCQCQRFRRRGAAARRRTRFLGAERGCPMQRWPRALPPRRRAASPSRTLTRLGPMFCCRDPGVAPRRRKALPASRIARTAASLRPTDHRRYESGVEKILVP